MVDEKCLTQLEQGLQRIFGLKIGRTTFREAQNAILSAVQGNKDDANTILDMMLSGDVKESLLGRGAVIQARALTNSYGVAFRLSRDVYERGDFLQVITSDTIYQGEHPLFVNRIRRVDGKEHQFICDVHSTIHLLTHFLSRLQELEASNAKKRYLKPISKEIIGLKQRLDQLTKSMESQTS